MFDINVKQIANGKEFDEVLEHSGKLVVCAGRWGPMCIPVYGAMEQLEKDARFDGVLFCVVDFDSEQAGRIRNLEECRHFRGLPFTVYYLDGKVVHATTSIQTQQQLEENIIKYLLAGEGEGKNENQ